LETRHQSHFGTLQAVGYRQLSDAGNAEQYALKKERVTNLIRRYVATPVARPCWTPDAVWES